MSGCLFYDRDPTAENAVAFNLIDENGCNDSPNYYNPFAAATVPGVNGMYLNQKPSDKELSPGKPLYFWTPSRQFSRQKDYLMGKGIN